LQGIDQHHQGMGHAGFAAHAVQGVAYRGLVDARLLGDHRGHPAEHAGHDEMIDVRRRHAA
tara:strand:+ start:830 stop:1012 length:183 start_codon:yes stop_codon:yes gene_type:complete